MKKVINLGWDFIKDEYNDSFLCCINEIWWRKCIIENFALHEAFNMAGKFVLFPVFFTILFLVGTMMYAIALVITLACGIIGYSVIGTILLIVLPFLKRTK